MAADSGFYNGTMAGVGLLFFSLGGYALYKHLTSPPLPDAAHTDYDSMQKYMDGQRLNGFGLVVSTGFVLGGGAAIIHGISQWKKHG